MAYSKPFLAVQDFAVGIQSINRLTDNNQAAYDLWSAKHGISASDPNPLTAIQRANRYGRHNDIKVARSVSHFDVVTADDGSVYLEAETAGDWVRSTYRVATGRWRIYLNTADIYGVIGTAYTTAAASRLVVARVVAGTGSGTSLALNGYIDVETWTVSTAAAVDFDFSLVVWGRVA